MLRKSLLVVKSCVLPWIVLFNSELYDQIQFTALNFCHKHTAITSKRHDNNSIHTQTIWQLIFTHYIESFSVITRYNSLSYTLMALNGRKFLSTRKWSVRKKYSSPETRHFSFLKNAFRSIYLLYYFNLTNIYVKQTYSYIFGGWVLLKYVWIVTNLKLFHPAQYFLVNIRDLDNGLLNL